MINYLLIILFVPVTGALTQRFSAYRMVVVGGTICAASVFIMALPTAWFQGSAGSMIVKSTIDPTATSRSIANKTPFAEMFSVCAE